MPEYEMPPPAVVAHFDQAYAETADMLDSIAVTHKTVLASNMGTREMCIAAAAKSLQGMFDHEALAQLLAVSVHQAVVGEPQVPR